MVFQRSHRLSSLFFILFLLFFYDWIISSFCFLSHRSLCSFKSAVGALYCIFHLTYHILQLQNFCLILFYDFYRFVKLFILFIYCFPDFVNCLSVFSCSSLSFLKTAIWILYQVNHRALCILGQLLKDYCDILVVSCFLIFHVPRSLPLQPLHLK